MKRIFNISLVIVLMFIFVPKTYAVTITTDNTKQGTTDTSSYLVTNKGNITINNVGSDTFKAYKILDFYFNSSTNVVTHEFTNDFKTFLATTDDYKTLTVDEYRNLTSGDISNGSTQTTSTLDELVSQYATYIGSNTVSSNGLTTSNSSATGTVEVGSYLVLPNSASSVYAVMVGNVGLEYENNVWNIKGCTIVAKKSSMSITKTIINGATVFNNKYYINSSDEFTSRLVVNVPDFPTNATTHTFKVIAKEGVMNSFSDISEGLEFASTVDSIIVKDGEQQLQITDIEDVSSSEKYSANIKNGSNNVVGAMIYMPEWDSLGLDTDNSPRLSIVFNKDYISSNTITIEYKTKMVVDDDMDYSSFEDGIGSAGYRTSYNMCVAPYDETNNCVNNTFNLYSYGIKVITKDGSNNILSGAEYKLYSDSNFTTEIGSFVTYGKENYITGLTPGKYYIKQITAPTDNSLNNEVFTVSIEESQEGFVILDVTNTVELLPVTGGPGTILMVVVGILVVIGAIAYYKIYTKKKANQAV